MVFKNTERTGKIQALYQDIIRLFRETITEGWGAYVTVQVIITAAHYCELQRMIDEQIVQLYNHCR